MDIVAVFVDQDARPLKGLRHAIEAVALAAADTTPPPRLWVLGQGNERYRPLAEELGVGHLVTLLGHRDDIQRWYQAADLLLLPTAFETFSRSAHEAAACGIPVVAPRVSGIRELIGDDEAGLVVHRDPTDLGRALRTLAGSRVLRETLGAEARDGLRPFPSPAAASRILKTYDARAPQLKSSCGESVAWTPPVVVTSGSPQQRQRADNGEHDDHDERTNTQPTKMHLPVRSDCRGRTPGWSLRTRRAAAYATWASSGRARPCSTTIRPTAALRSSTACSIASQSGCAARKRASIRRLAATAAASSSAT